LITRIKIYRRRFAFSKDERKLEETTGFPREKRELKIIQD